MEQASREQLLSRLQSAQGHLGGIHRMLLGGSPSTEIVFQVRAVRSALRHLEARLVQEGLYGCFERARGGQTKAALEAMLELFNLQGHSTYTDGLPKLHKEENP